MGIRLLSPRLLASPSYPQSALFSIMEIELCPAVSLLPETNSHPELQRYKILFISGN